MAAEQPDYVLSTLDRLEENIKTQSTDIQKLKTWFIILMAVNMCAGVFNSVPVEAIVGFLN